MSKARLYLDVDGCINLFGGSTWPSRQVRSGVATLIHDGFGQVIEAGGWSASRNPSYRIQWTPELIEELNALDVELVWLTTWCHNATDLIAPMVGLTLPSRVLEPLSGQVSFPSIDWKVPALAKDVKNFTGKVVWIEDEFTFDDETPPGALRVRPNPNWGISPGDIEKIKAYLASN